MNTQFNVPGMDFDSIDMEIVYLTQSGIPLISRPYSEFSKKIGISEEEFISRLEKMKKIGFIRKIAAAPNHYKLGYTANAMTVWDIPEKNIDKVGAIFQGIHSISHCYIRPRALPLWPYNLFAMFHGQSREEVNDKVDSVKLKIENLYVAVELIYSTKILKKTGIRLKVDQDV